MVLASLESDAPPIFSPSNALASPLELRMEEERQQDLDAALHDSDLATPANPQPLPDAAPLPPEAPALFHGKPAPLPPVRPAALKVTPAELVAALPEPPVPPAAGPEPVIGPSPSPAPSPAPVARAAPPAAAMAANSQGSFPSVANALAAVTASVGGASAAVTPMQPPAGAVPDGAEIGGFKKGSPVYVRIFKKEGVLELWLKRGDNYALYKSFPVCKWSGQLGPKTRQADYQSPEGFYSVSARQLNPNSHYHLAFDIGYPNAYDRRQGSTGNSVMVHGDCKSVGCFAMTNNGIDEIYGIVEAALRNGQREVPVHIFPVPHDGRGDRPREFAEAVHGLGFPRAHKSAAAAGLVVVLAQSEAGLRHVRAKPCAASGLRLRRPLRVRRLRRLLRPHRRLVISLSASGERQQASL